MRKRGSATSAEVATAAAAAVNAVAAAALARGASATRSSPIAKRPPCKARRAVPP